MKSKQYNARLSPEYQAKLDDLMKANNLKTFKEIIIFLIDKDESGVEDDSSTPSSTPPLGDPQKICNYGSIAWDGSIESKKMVYCDNPRKKNLPRNKEITLIVCNKCFSRREWYKKQRPTITDNILSTQHNVSKTQFFSHIQFDLISCPRTEGRYVAVKKCSNCPTKTFLSCPSIHKKVIDNKIEPDK